VACIKEISLEPSDHDCLGIHRC